MTRPQLQRASDELSAAAELTDGDAKDRLEYQADQLATLATRESETDHGRLARHTNALRELAAATEGEAAAHVEAAMDAISEYRETLDGV
ncbi:DUF7553 family protein [Haloplanus halophilus]|uniref:DUF7553 family protein n=1 Tax=Haloplanus halophilus TaxID=2949993 RepID=UPI002041FF04|nr:hypothetical protein [Haloplanus sp. GDY1]